MDLFDPKVKKTFVYMDPRGEEEARRVERIIAVRTLLRERDKARQAFDFTKSDILRDKIKAQFGAEVVDQKSGPSGFKFIDGTSAKLPPGAKIPEEATKKRNREKEDEGDEGGGNKKNKGGGGGGGGMPTSKLSQPKSKKEKREEKKADQPSKLSIEQERNKAALSSLISSSSSPGSKNISGVLIEEMNAGHGKVAQKGNNVKVHYIGRLKLSGKVFDSSLKKPFSFRLGRGEVIRGWDIGVEGMREGAKRKLTIPPEKAYGKAGAPPTIPSNATLVFEVTLLEVCS